LKKTLLYNPSSFNFRAENETES